MNSATRAMNQNQTSKQAFRVEEKEKVTAVKVISINHLPRLRLWQKWNGRKSTGIISIEAHTHTHWLRSDLVIFCAVGRQVCHFKVSASVCKWVSCLTLVWFCTTDKALKKRAIPQWELYGWQSILITAGGNGMSPCRVIVPWLDVYVDSK